MTRWFLLYLQHLSILYLIFGARDKPNDLFPYGGDGLELKLDMENKVHLIQSSKYVSFIVSFQIKHRYKLY